MRACELAVGASMKLRLHEADGLVTASVAPVSIRRTHMELLGCRKMVCKFAVSVDKDVRVIVILWNAANDEAEQRASVALSHAMR